MRGRQQKAVPGRLDARREAKQAKRCAGGPLPGKVDQQTAKRHEVGPASRVYVSRVVRDHHLERLASPGHTVQGSSQQDPPLEAHEVLLEKAAAVVGGRIFEPGSADTAPRQSLAERWRHDLLAERVLVLGHGGRADLENAPPREEQ
jgi:hypothetical protein